MNDDKPIVRCVCFDRTFEEMKVAGWQSLEDILQETKCGTKCGLCVPYIRRMLDTGETRFSIED